MPSVAVIDIGSNSIKVLVAERGTGRRLNVLATQTLDARISSGISRAQPSLSEAGMSAGVAAIEALLKLAAPYQPAHTVLVATSAVRDAANGADFKARVQSRTGQVIRILTGDEEANLIGRGLTCDPALAGLQDFYVFDLGGGSLECLAFRQRRIEREASLQLGCVRLTETFVSEPTAPFPENARTAITAHTRALLGSSRFSFSLPVAAAAIGTGGTVTVARAILAARLGKTVEASSPEVSLGELRELLNFLGAMPLDVRRTVPGLPAARADVMPTALATLIAVAEAGGFDRYRHSFFNLRYGLADEALDVLQA